jgi:indolepyruvate ferredoxin oxidoreductase
LHDQFEGELRLQLHMAPPLLARPRDGQPPRKLRFGAWLLPLLKLLAHGRRLRGGALDVFGHTQERRMERGLIGEYEARVDMLLSDLDAARLPLATLIAQLPLSMRGYGHVKAANVALARVREAELLHRWDPARFARPQTAAQAGQLKGVAVVSA